MTTTMTESFGLQHLICRGPLAPCPLVEEVQEDPGAAKDVEDINIDRQYSLRVLLPSRRRALRIVS